MKAWRENNKEKRRILHKEWRKRNPEKIREYRKKYKKSHPLKVKEHQMRRRKAPTDIMRRYKKGAIRRGHLFSLLLNEFTEMLYGVCHYCGKKGTKEDRNGIDRKNNNDGYTKSNSVSCCFSCNKFKGNKDYSFFVEKVNNISSYLCRK